LGNEVYLGSNFYEILEQGEFFTLAGSDYILIEFNFVDIPKNIAEICYEAKLKGYKPIIAHAERYVSLFNDKELLKDILNEGAFLQVNASTIINKESKENCKFAHYLLKNELISFIASDMHNMDSRGFYLDEAYQYITKKCSKTYAEQIFITNQQHILSNKYFENPKIDTKINTSNKGFFSKLFRHI
jgi:protein-tyrosine phosphatase